MCVDGGLWGTGRSVALITLSGSDPSTGRSPQAWTPASGAAGKSQAPACEDRRWHQACWVWGPSLELAASGPRRQGGMGLGPGTPRPEKLALRVKTGRPAGF